jgi:hypothetical protein
MPKTDCASDSQWIILTITPDSISAQMAQQLLQSAGIETWVEEVNVKSETAFLSGIQYGYRVLVGSKDKDEAHAVLNPTESSFDASLDDATSASEVEKEEEGARAARKALQVAVLGFLLGPLLHPFSLIMALRVLQRNSLPGRSRRDARVAAVISLFSLVFFALVIHSLLR